MKERIMAYEGSCHCGAVTYTVEGDIPDTAMSCNCSHCRRKGFLLTFVPIDQFRLTGGADLLTSYMFNKHIFDHHFCDALGCQSFSVCTTTDVPKMASFILRCLPDADLSALPIMRSEELTYELQSRMPISTVFIHLK